MLEQANTLAVSTYCPVKAQNAGLFISRGAAMHPTRIIDSHELIFVKQGELDMWEENRTFHLEAGQTLHLWPGRQHGSTKPMELGLKFYWIHFDIGERDSKDEYSTGDRFAPALKVPQMSRMAQPERLEGLFLTFLKDQETGMLHPHSANLLTMLMLVEIAQSVDEGSGHAGDQHIVAARAHTFIRINFDRPITTSKVAELLGYDADYLGRIYRKMYGCTLTEAIHRRRIRAACHYLMDSDLTIEQIAQQCGYADPDYFRRVFRRHMHVSPNEYRKECSHIHINTH
jgi:AraC-like DNA-binding protein